MAMLNLNSSSSTTEEHHQTGHLPLPSELKNNKCYRNSDAWEVFVFVEKYIRREKRKLFDLPFERMGKIAISLRKSEGKL